MGEEILPETVVLNTEIILFILHENKNVCTSVFCRAVSGNGIMYPVPMYVQPIKWTPVNPNRVVI